MKSLLAIAEEVTDSLQQFYPVMRVTAGGSIYIKLRNSNVKQIRVANHVGRKTSRKCWELRTDVMSKRYSSGHIYNARHTSALIRAVKLANE